jgi:RNA polymerase sigma-70 factor (ECF subfamily)
MDINGFKERILPLSPKLYHYACLLLKDKTEAQDAVQEVCLRLWKIRDSLDKLNSIEAFAMKVTRNWCLDRVKASKPVYVPSYLTLFEGKSDDTDPHHMLERTDRLKILYELLEKLPEQQRQIIQLREFEYLEYEEIANIMDMNVNAVRVNLSRARNRLKEEMLKKETDGYQSNIRIDR